MFLGSLILFCLASHPHPGPAPSLDLLRRSPSVSALSQISSHTGKGDPGKQEFRETGHPTPPGRVLKCTCSCCSPNQSFLLSQGRQEWQTSEHQVAWVVPQYQPNPSSPSLVRPPLTFQAVSVELGGRQLVMWEMLGVTITCSLCLCPVAPED